MKNFTKANALNVLRSCLILAVAIVSGVLIIDLAGPILIFVMTIAVEIALFVVVGSLTYAMAEKLVDRLWKIRAPVIDWRSVRNVVQYPFGAPLEQ